MPSIKPIHPFYPLSLELPHYTSPQLSLTQILTQFFTGVAALLVICWVIARRSPKSLGTGSKLAFQWWILCGFIHLGIEAYFAATHATIAGNHHFPAQVLKEYSKSDSRYMRSDSFVVVMEAVTGFIVGPLSFLTAYLIYTSHPSYHVPQLLTSTCQLYGVVLYYGTAVFDGLVDCDPNPYYVWFYFVVMNLPWVVIPG
ncbi:hypothetical protein HK104_000734, partial [Borealophlyctis nickersoniae]